MHSTRAAAAHVSAGRLQRVPRLPECMPHWVPGKSGGQAAFGQLAGAVAMGRCVRPVEVQGMWCVWGVCGGWGVRKSARARRRGAGSHLEVDVNLGAAPQPLALGVLRDCKGAVCLGLPNEPGRCGEGWGGVAVDWAVGLAARGGLGLHWECRLGCTVAGG